MNIEKDYYQILGVSQNANFLSIKSAYRALCSLYHPDKNIGENTSEIMQEINEAYEVLSNDYKRKEYDKQRTNFSSDFNHNKEEKPDFDPLNDEWEIFEFHYPDLKVLLAFSDIIFVPSQLETLPILL